MIGPVVRLRVLDEVTWDGKPVPGERTHALLRALAEAGRRGLGEHALVEEIWLEDPPANPTKALQVVVSRARSATSAEAIERTPRGYRLALPHAEVDAWALRPEALRLVAEGQYAEALPLLDQLARIDEHGDEEVVEARLRATAAVQGAPAALDAYEAYRDQLVDRLGVDPAPRLQDLHRELLARDAPVRAGLRFDADAMIGRDADVAALAALVHAHRLVSIVGAGGLGKTRLAHLMGRRAEQPVVHFVELVSVTSDEGVAVEVADAVGARESVARRGQQLAATRSDPVGRIVDLIGTVPALLILDNCEQVVAGVAELVSALLAHTPALTVLTTTRTPLGLAAERTYLLPELSTADAAALFHQRAEAARPGAVLDPERVRALVSRLDGLPLAVELAAAKVRVMSVPEIEHRLENRFALLRGGARDAPERHQTLLAVIDWSWNLLTEAERVALRRLSVFRDGFSLDGANAVLGPGDGQSDALDVLTALVEQSLVVVAEEETLRYRLLETVREFGRMQLVDAGDDGATSERLRAWAMALCRSARRRLFSPAQVETMTLLRAEEGNLVEALRRANAADDAEAAAVLLGALVGFWSVEGSHLKIVNLAAPGLALLAEGSVPVEAEDDLRGALASTIFVARIFAGGSAGVAVEAGLARLRSLGPDSPHAQTRAIVTGVLALSQGAEADQLGLLGELAEEPDRHLAQWASILASQAAENLGELGQAIAMGERALTVTDPADGPWSEGLIRAHLAGLLLQLGDRGKARAYAEAAIPVMAELGAVEDWVQTSAVVALAAMADGALGDAERILDGLSGDDRAESVFGGAISLLCGRAELLLAQGRVEEGLAAYDAAVVRISARSIPGFELDGLEPWIVFPGAAALAAHCRHGHRDQATPHRDRLLAKATELLGRQDQFLDHPIVGSVLFALAAWELLGDPSSSAGARLYGLAERFSFNRMLPSLDPAWLVPLLPHGPETLDVPRERLREEAADLLAQLT